MLILTRLLAVVAVQTKQYFVYPRVCPFRNRTVKACLADEKHPSRILDGYIPCSLFYFNNVDHLQTGLSKMIEDFLRKDDVFCDDFLEHILIVLANGEELSQPIAQGICTAIGAKTVSEVNFAGSPAPKPGPYFLGNDGLSEAWRCYSDPLAAFVRPIVPSLVGNKYEDPGIPVYPVPSRLYSEPKSEKRPLAGLRFAVKDVIDIAGVPTTNCCRAYEELYGVASETAPLIQKLIEKGAIPVGKARTVQFASGSHPMDWIDWQCPFNPRGDGYQSPSMSSAGSAAAVSGYDWVDFSIGTDTFGSVLMPAAACGIYGFRPTTGIQDLTGILPVSSYLDTAGFFTRSIASATLLAKEWLGEDIPHNLTNHPTEIIYPVDLFHFENSEYQSVAERFVGLLEKFLGVKSSRMNLTERWGSSAYSDGKSLRDYLDSTIPKIQLRDCYNNAEHFRQSYTRHFRKKPYVDPVIRYKWDLSMDITDEQYEQGIVEKHTFEQWMSTEINPPSSKSILLLPGGLDSPTYRDQYYGTVEESGRKMQGYGFSPYLIPPLASLPTALIPVGQFAYNSRVSGTVEQLPVSLTISSFQGGDCGLWDMLARLIERSEGIPSQVATGKLLFPDQDP